MNYVILVSHGEFAQGLHQALTMFVGEREDVVSIGLRKDEDVDHLALRMEDMMQGFQEEDQFLILGDLIGGSPLTTMLNCMEKNGFLKQSVVVGGMNLAMALNAVLMKEDLQQAKEMALSEGKTAIKELQLSNEEEDEI